MVLVKMSYFLVQFGFFWVLNNTIQYNNSRQVIITSWRDSLRSLYKQSSIYIHTAHSIPTSVSGQGGLVTEAWGRSLPPSPPPSTFSTVDAWPLRRRGRKPLRGWGGGVRGRGARQEEGEGGGAQTGWWGGGGGWIQGVHLWWPQAFPDMKS